MKWQEEQLLQIKPDNQTCDKNTVSHTAVEDSDVK
jgi:hypothetical protein